MNCLASTFDAVELSVSLMDEVSNGSVLCRYRAFEAHEPVARRELGAAGVSVAGIRWRTRAAPHTRTEPLPAATIRASRVISITVPGSPKSLRGPYSQLHTLIILPFKRVNAPGLVCSRECD